MFKTARLLLILVVLPLLLLVTPERAAACSCVSFSPRDALDGSTAVFSGQVVNIRPVTGLSNGRHLQVTLQVSRVWKGPVQDRLEVFTPAFVVSCGYEFQVGVMYLVYAYGPENQLEVSLCSRTQRLPANAQDLQVLGPGQAPPSEVVDLSGNLGTYLLLALLGAGIATGLIAALVMFRERTNRNRSLR